MALRPTLLLKASLCALLVVFACAPVREKRAPIPGPNALLVCESSAAIRKKMTILVNQARSENRRCGGAYYPEAPAVRWNPSLFAAAALHSKDMAASGRLSHRGSKGETADRRLNVVGYGWKTVAENISAGYEASEDVVQGWLASSDHCANIMNANVLEIGAACRRNPSSKYGTYWTLVLAAPIK